MQLNDPVVKIIRTIVLMTIGPMGFAQSDPGLFSARAHGLGGISVTLQGIDALYYNPAGATSMKSSGIHIGSGQTFAIGALTQVNAVAAFKTGDAAFVSVGVTQFGFEIYQERTLNAGYSIALFEGFSAGAQLRVYQLSIENYGSKITPGLTLGIQYDLGNQLVLGGHVRNPIAIDESLPSVLALGLQYKPGQAITLYSEIEKDIDFAPRIHLAAEYMIHSSFVLRVGAASNPGSFHFGAGYEINDSFRIDIAVGYHPILGISPAIGLVFHPRSK